MCEMVTTPAETCPVPPYPLQGSPGLVAGVLRLDALRA